jgi:hypothetical protein
MKSSIKNIANKSKKPPRRTWLNDPGFLFFIFRPEEDDSEAFAPNSSIDK